MLCIIMAGLFLFTGCKKDDGEIIPPKNADGRDAQLCVSNGRQCVSLYPNPTQSEITISTNNPKIKIIFMEVYDVYGKSVSLQNANHFYSTLKMNKLVNGGVHFESIFR